MLLYIGVSTFFAVISLLGYRELRLIRKALE